MQELGNEIDMKCCRICLSKTNPVCPLFRYKLSGNYAEMLTAIADVKVSSNDGLPDKICLKCCTTLEKAYLLKTVSERSDKKLRKLLAKAKENVATKKIAFDSFTDIKSEIGTLAIKSEPKWEFEIDVKDELNKTPIEVIEPKEDIVIANTIIRKVDPNSEETKAEEVLEEKADISWKTTAVDKQDDSEIEYLDDAFQDDDDEDYVPPTEKTKAKTKFKKPKLSDIKVFKPSPVIRKIKVIKKIRDESSSIGRKLSDRKSTSITCYPILKNGSRGAPIILKRPKDSTILKVHASYKADKRIVKREKPVKVVKPVTKAREKLVCPVCGILTYTLGNHITTHQEKKKYACSQCTKTFSQKTNLEVHMKQHTGIKDHICEVCGAGFYSQKSLVRHNLIHKGDRPFSCHLCNKKFIAKQPLERHIRIHYGDKRFACNICGKLFMQSHHLENHSRTHTGDKPFQCKVCNVAFSYKVNLNNHVYKVHGINLKFKSIHTVTEAVLRREMGMVSETSVAISNIMPQLSDVPTPAAHETVHHTSEY